MPLFPQRINSRLVLGPLLLRVCEKKSEKWTGKWNLDPGVGSSTDRPQEALGSLKRPLTSQDHSPAMRRLSQVCDQFQP